MKLIFLYLSILILNDKDSIDQVLNNLHKYASEANGEKYLALFDDEAVFYGTDAKERWHINEFKKYTLGRFKNGVGWTYKPIKRNIYINESTAWFDEEIENKKYGVFRGSGVLVKNNNRWLISQYNLLLPIPNEKLIEYSKEIKSFLNNNK